MLVLSDFELTGYFLINLGEMTRKMSILTFIWENHVVVSAPNSNDQTSMIAKSEMVPHSRELFVMKQPFQNGYKVFVELNGKPHCPEFALPPLK